MMASIVCLFAFIMGIKSQTINISNHEYYRSHDQTHYTSYHFEYSSSQWFTNMQNNEIISCTIKMPSLCIYAIPNQPSFQLFYEKLMFDFLNDDQWDKINIIQSKKHDKKTRRRLRRRRRRKRRRKRRKRNFMFSGPGSYGCFNALCTTVLGPPQIIGPPIPRHRRRRSNYKKCDRCGNKKYPGYIYTGGPGVMGPMGGINPFSMQMSRLLSMRGMGGQNRIHVVTHKSDSEKKIKKKAKKKSTKPTIKKKKRRLTQIEPLIDESEYKIIQKCVNIKQYKNILICVTYYYIDKSISLDYNIMKTENKLLSKPKYAENYNKYYETFVWIVDKYNDKLLCKNYKIGIICVDGIKKDNVIITVNNNKQIELNDSKLDEVNYSYLYDIYFMRDDNIIRKQKLCKNIFVKIDKSNAKLCVEMFDGDSDEIEISVETIVHNDQH
eukprot:420448_1